MSFARSRIRVSSSTTRTTTAVASSESVITNTFENSLIDSDYAAPMEIANAERPASERKALIRKGIWSGKVPEK